MPSLNNSRIISVALVAFRGRGVGEVVSTEPKLNSYLFLRKARVGATATAFGAKMYKNNFAQVLTTRFLSSSRSKIPYFSRSLKML